MKTKAIRRGKIYTDGKWMDQLVMVFDEKIIGMIHENDVDQWLTEKGLNNIEWIDAEGRWIVPGFIDTHIHGFKGYDTMDGEVSSVTSIAKEIAANGVTSFLPTTMTMPFERIERALDAVEEARKVQENELDGARIIGVHLEGPYINENYHGAQPKEAIRPPEALLLEKYSDLIKVVTIAPEVEGAMELISQYKDQVCFSMGHTGASYEVATEAIQCGVKGCTHLFNAMTGLHHRNPGVVGAAFKHDVYAELIADTIHVHPSIYDTVINQIGEDKLLLITDCMNGGGLEDGLYSLGGQDVHIIDGVCRLNDGTIAGSVLRLDQGLRNVVKHSGYSLEQLLPLVSMNQAKYLGVDDMIGSLEEGKMADFVVLDKDCEVAKTVVNGRCVYEREA